MTRTEIEAIRQRIDQSVTPLILTHERPDGDAIGSLLAMGLALKRRDKSPSLVIKDGIPARFLFLPGAKDVQKNLPDHWDLLIVLDCSDIERTGFGLEAIGGQPDINIDHHPTNDHFAAINYLDDNAAATTELLFHLFRALEIPLTPAISNTLMLGILTDTIGFRTPSVHPTLFRTAAELQEAGADLVELYDRALNQRSFIGARYWGRGLKQLERSGEILWTQLTLEDRNAVGYPGDDDADLINLLTTIESPLIAIIFVEQSDSQVKVSWRSKLGYNVAQVASTFGGGGHEQAAGAMITGALAEVKDKVLRATQELLDASNEESA